MALLLFSAQLVVVLSIFGDHQGAAVAVGGEREGRSLVNSFPFTEARPAKQFDDEGPGVNFNSVAAASASGQKCIDKIITEEEIEYDEVYECNHSYNKRCTTSYTTTYEAQQEEECEENYKKSCFIEYSQTAYDTTVEVCVEPLVKDCGAVGPEVCSTEYQSECETVQEEHNVEDDVVECREEVESKCEDVTSGYTSSQKCSEWPVQKCDVQKKQVKKFSPETSCKKVPVELCGPAACPAVPGPKECYEIKKTIAGEKPGEECSLEPKRVCKFVTKLVPQLKPHESCVDVPKEVCVRSQTNPRKVSKPVVKKWCYTPSEESGLPVEAVEVETDEDSLSQPAPQQSCPARCSDAIRSGACDPTCDTYTNICGPCVPKCPARCSAAISSGNCDPSCDQYSNICGPCVPPPPPQCPARCKEAIRSGNCDPTCSQYNDLCGKCIPPPKTTPQPTCPPKCSQAIQQGVCDPSCDAFTSLCGPCVPKTTPPPPQCPARCREAIQTGNCDESCTAYTSICGECVPPPPQCPARCQAAVLSGKCDSSCTAYNDVCGPCVPTTTTTTTTPPPLPGGYLPPPPENPRSSSPHLGNSIALQPRPQFNRKVAENVRSGSSGLVSQITKNRVAQPNIKRGGRKDSRPSNRPRNNWDLYFREGIVKKKG